MSRQHGIWRATASTAGAEVGVARGWLRAQRAVMRSYFRLICAVWLAVVAAEACPFMALVYNVENLHDADGIAQFEDYQPARYSKAHVLTKLNNIGENRGAV